MRYLDAVLRALEEAGRPLAAAEVAEAAGCGLHNAHATLRALWVRGDVLRAEAVLEGRSYVVQVFSLPEEASR